MACRVCESENQKKFPAEVNIHPPRGIRYLNKPALFAFPEFLVCLDCGFTELVLEETARSVLAQRYGDGKLAAAGRRNDADVSVLPSTDSNRS